MMAAQTNVQSVRLAIVGCRSFQDYQKFCGIVEPCLTTLSDEGPPSEVPRTLTIISGGATGVDAMAKYYANEKKILYTEFAADWQRFGAKAGPLRNTQIVAACTHMLALPSANSRGTHDSIQKARAAGKKLKVVNI